jgi:hypothetical protein
MVMADDENSEFVGNAAFLAPDFQENPLAAPQWLRHHLALPKVIIESERFGKTLVF